MTSFLDWLGRVIMLVLAGMITLSIISAIAAIPSGVVPARIAAEPRQWPVQQAEEQPLPAQPTQRPRAAPGEDSVTASGAQGTTPGSQDAIDSAGWLEAITYALLALVGIGVFAIILLWRALGHWRRMADSLERARS